MPILTLVIPPSQISSSDGPAVSSSPAAAARTALSLAKVGQLLGQVLGRQLGRQWKVVARVPMPRALEDWLSRRDEVG